MLLAFFDFLIAVFYIPLMSVSVLADYVLAPDILNAWFSYMRVLITICHISMTASAFLILGMIFREFSFLKTSFLAASFKRYCFTCWTSKVRFVNRFRQTIAASAVFFGIITKLSMYFEYNVSCVIFKGWKCIFRSLTKKDVWVRWRNMVSRQLRLYITTTIIYYGALDSETL
jgi:hypothetical protein